MEEISQDSGGRWALLWLSYVFLGMPVVGLVTHGAQLLYTDRYIYLPALLLVPAFGWAVQHAVGMCDGREASRLHKFPPPSRVPRSHGAYQPRTHTAGQEVGSGPSGSPLVSSPSSGGPPGPEGPFPGGGVHLPAPRSPHTSRDWIASYLRSCRVGVLVVAAATVVTLLIGEAVVTRSHIERWRSNLALWSWAVEAGPECHSSYHNLGSALFVRGRQAEASGYLQESLRVFATPLVHQLLGNIAMTGGRYRDAVRRYDEAFEIGHRGLLDRHRAEIFHNLGVVYATENLDRPEEPPDMTAARKLFEEAVRLHRLPQAMEALGLAALKQADYAVSERWYLEAIRAGREFPENFDSLGIALFHQGRVKEAEGFAQKALAREGQLQTTAAHAAAAAREGHDGRTDRREIRQRIEENLSLYHQRLRG